MENRSFLNFSYLLSSIMVRILSNRDRLIIDLFFFRKGKFDFGNLFSEIF